MLRTWPIGSLDQAVQPNSEITYFHNQSRTPELDTIVTVAYQLNSDTGVLRFASIQHSRRSRQYLTQLIQALDPLNHHYLELKSDYEDEMHRSKTWCRKRAVSEATKLLQQDPKIINLGDFSDMQNPSKLQLESLIMHILQDPTGQQSNLLDVQLSTEPESEMADLSLLEKCNKYVLYFLAFYASFFYVDLLFT